MNRKYEAGKKITWKDGVRAIWCIFKYNVCRAKNRTKDFESA